MTLLELFDCNMARGVIAAYGLRCRAGPSAREQE